MTSHDVIRLADIPRKADPVAQEWDRLLTAGEDDAVYERAKDVIETAPATSLRGVHAKFAVLKADLTYHFSGSRLTRTGEIEVLGLLGGIEEALARLTDYRVPAHWTD